MQRLSPRASLADLSFIAAWTAAKLGRASGRCALHAAMSLASQSGQCGGIIGRNPSTMSIAARRDDCSV